MGDLLGAVLTGGRSTRMGRDKALMPVDGVPMAVIVARVLADAGAARIVAVGGDGPALRQHGLDVVSDPRQGEGPLGGISAALHAADGFEVVVVLACDLLDASPVGVRRIVDRLMATEGAELAVPVVGGRHEPLHAAWRPAAAPVVDAALDRGERAVHAVFNRLTTVEVHDLDPAWFRNVNSPEQLGHT